MSTKNKVRMSYCEFVQSMVTVNGYFEEKCKENGKGDPASFFYNLLKIEPPPNAPIDLSSIEKI